jgi:hypothetical protein
MVSKDFPRDHRSTFQMSVLSTNERYLLSGHVSVTEDVPHRPRSIHLRLTADSLSKIAERGDEDILKIFDVDKDEGVSVLACECFLLLTLD